VIDALSNTDSESSPNELTQFILGGRTQIEAALEESPTFATVWIGNNDVLSAANAGSPALATGVSTFAQRYKTLTDSLANNAPLEGAVLIGVADVKEIPGILNGEVYFGLEQDPSVSFPNSFDVASNCAPNPAGQGSTNQISFLFFLNQLNEAIQKPSQPSGTYGVSCSGTDPGALTPGELQDLSDRASEYNDEIEAIAAGDDNPFVFFDPNDEFRQIAGQAPSPPAFGSQQPFGPFFSLDGVHPNSDAHRLITNRLVQLINTEFDANLTPLENAPSLP
jgi:lysophospholipase L1-like esterase